MRGCIYKYSCLNTDKIYIGSSTNYLRRWKAHHDRLRANSHHSIHLQRSYNRHGEESFKFTVIEFVDDTILLLIREQCWLWRNKGKLYNMSPTAGSPLGVKHSIKARRKHSQRMRGNRIRRGTRLSARQRSQISESLRGNSYRSGIPHASDIREKISVGLKKAYREGRHKMPDRAKCANNLAHWNKKVKAGEVQYSFSKPERNRAMLWVHAKLKSLKKTGTIFGITPVSVWSIVKKIQPQPAWYTRGTDNS